MLWTEASSCAVDGRTNNTVCNDGNTARAIELDTEREDSATARNKKSFSSDAN